MGDLTKNRRENSYTSRIMKRMELLEQVRRRSIVKGAGAVALASGVGAEFVGTSRGWENTSVTVRQGGECVEVEPLVGQEDVVDLYGYTADLAAEAPRQSNLPSQLEEPGTSRLFFYDGPEGFSLVIVHGGDDDPGGAATFLVCGLPAPGGWVTLDDRYEGAADEFLIEDHEAVLHWGWGVQGRNDGAVFRGFSKEFCVSIVPAFGDDALRELLDGGTVEAWQFLSGDLDDPDVIDLEMDEPITLATGSCDEREACCTVSTETIEDPFDVDVTFCCTSAMIDTAEYDSVRFHFLEGTEQRFEGPFEGLRTFLADADHDGNPNDEVVRSVTINAGGDSVTVRNPNFECCREALTSDEGDGEIAY